RRAERVALISASLLTGSAVSMGGPVPFVGIIVPHIVRLIVGADHRLVLPAALLFGGSFLVVCDLVARTAFGPVGMPVRAGTGLIGGPFLLWLLFRKFRCRGDGRSSRSRSPSRASPAQVVSAFRQTVSVRLKPDTTAGRSTSRGRFSRASRRGGSCRSSPPPLKCCSRWVQGIGLSPSAATIGFRRRWTSCRASAHCSIRTWSAFSR